MSWIRWHWAEWPASILIALLVGTFVEYVVHRLMHRGTMFHKTHAKHHQTGEGQGWLGEFKDYFFPTIPVLWIGFPFSLAAGIGFAVGGIFYACLAAYAHQLQHENPELCFWMRRPVHYLHHEHKMWHHNFGISFSLWDHVFGTYKKVKWEPGKRARDYPLSTFFKIKWF